MSSCHANPLFHYFLSRAFFATNCSPVIKHWSGTRDCAESMQNKYTEFTHNRQCAEKVHLLHIVTIFLPLDGQYYEIEIPQNLTSNDKNTESTALCISKRVGSLAASLWVKYRCWSEGTRRSAEFSNKTTTTKPRRMSWSLETDSWFCRGDRTFSLDLHEHLFLFIIIFF